MLFNKLSVHIRSCHCLVLYVKTLIILPKKCQAISSLVSALKKRFYFLPGPDARSTQTYSSLVESAKNSELSFASYRLFVALHGMLELMSHTKHPRTILHRSSPLITMVTFGTRYHTKHIPEPVYTGVPL